jgi:hypothetical protein
MIKLEINAKQTFKWALSFKNAKITGFEFWDFLLQPY